MLLIRNLFYFIFLHLIPATPQINFHYTDWVSESESDNALQHDCLRVAASIEKANVSRQIISYCMSESPSKFNVEKNDFFPNFTYAELSKQNITSQQLYLWSASIDVIERYQFYLNQLSTSNELSLATEVYYNCTMPRFGSMCQYEFDYHHPNHSSLYEIIRDFYNHYEYYPTNFTCYMHLQCNRGPFPACLDWSEICDGKVDCLDGEFDEEHCWQLEINECKDNEYQCPNGQCIPQSYYRDDLNTPDCLDGSDERQKNNDKYDISTTREPSFGWADVACIGQFFTSSCVKQRRKLLLQAMFSINDNSISDHCFYAFKCIIHKLDPIDSTCADLCKGDMCVQIIERTCPDMLYIPNVPVLFGHIYFAFEKHDAIELNNLTPVRRYLCYNNSRYDNYFVGALKVLLNNATCYRPIAQGININSMWNDIDLRFLYTQLSIYNPIFNYNSTICNRSNTYQCNNSLKCIPIRRVNDRIRDCPYMDDEKINDINNNVLTETLIGIHPWYDDEMKMKLRRARTNVSFQTICDGFTDLLPVTIKGRNETDETECEQWQCNNTYTRCDGLWNCLNGADEVDCDLSPPLNCSSDHQLCVSPHTNQFMCLPIKKANDGKVDCLGATDEPTLCRTKYDLSFAYNFYCVKNSSETCLGDASLCDDRPICLHGDDEQFCEKNRTFPVYGSICSLSYASVRSNVEKFLCENVKMKKREPLVYFSLDGVSKPVEDRPKNVKNAVFSSSSIIQKPDYRQPRCHRGLDLRVWLNNKNNLTTITCLCPPSFYGNVCQYQNQRVSLTIQFLALSDSWQTPFAIVISLIDDSDERIIHSYEQFTYWSVRDCKIKFNNYLLYSTRTKNQTKNYAIHIDIYEKVSLTYRGSLLFPVTFPFLPVHRLAFIVDIPRSDDNVQSCSNHQCVHGKCIRYSNNLQNATFCQCNQGWSGQYCNIPHNYTCTSNSLFIGVFANNRSVCVCPINKFGPRCLLVDTVCQTDNNSTCQNGGRCISVDEYMIFNQKFICICSKGYSGDRCEIVDNNITLSFGKDIVLSQSIFIHFIEVINNNIPVRATTFRTILITKDSVMIYWSRPFHLVFIELFNKNYYLTAVQKTYNRSAKIIKMIKSSDRCRHISEVFNETLVQLDLIRRIKYYHLPCQTYSPDLSCFYDDFHLCLCYDYGQQRLTNCFDFNHTMTFDCLGQSVCENGAQCLQDTADCPQRSMCICSRCFYGTKCQFSTNGFGLSLDAILGYHILPHVSIIHQPRIVQISLALIIVFIVAGLINGILAIITFNNKRALEVGCGVYLLGSSMTTLLTTIMFGLKFWILVLAQMTLISNRLFLQVQCISLDFLLRVCLNMDQWLNACVAMERAFTVMKGIRFDKKKSKQVAKLVIIILLVLIVGTSIHDPIHRRMIDEENDDEKRIWCIITYPPNLQVFDSIIHIFHFFLPFIINTISAVILITKKSRQRSNVQTHRTYKQLLREQFRQHKHLFTAPVLLVILAIPRLIISFASKCMETGSESWLFLIGYFISFISPMLTFVIFILPSKFYKKQFRESVGQYRTNIRRRLHLIS